MKAVKPSRRWRQLCASVATHANVIRTEEIERRLSKGGVRFYTSAAMTVRGTRCVRVFVEEGEIGKARELLADVLPAPITT